MDIYEEDGVAKEGPRENRNADDRDDDDFSMSSYDGDHSDSLVIKPPQAKILHRDKREKREKKDSHRHKSEKHKDRRRNKNRSTGHEERRREGRRHRKEGEKKEQKQRRKERSSKHERHSGDGRKHEKERRRRMAQGEMYEESRDPYDERERGGQHMRGHMGAHPSSLVYRGKRYESRMYGNQNFSAHHLSPREKTEREKRMEKFMLAEKQKEITQKEADVRRQRREEEKIEELRRRAEASMLRHTGRTRSANDYHEDHHRRKKKKLEPETVELISDEENDFSPNDMEVDLDEVEMKRGDERGYDKADVEEEEEGMIKEVGEVDNKVEIASSKSSSSSESSDSDSSSSSSSEGEDNEVDEAETVHENEEKIEPKDEDVKDKISGSRSSVHSLSGDTTDEEKKESDDENKFVDENYNLDESPVPSSPELKEDLPPYFPAIMGCRSVDEFTCLNKIEEGTYGVVYRAKEKSSGEIVALKRLKMEKEKEGFPITSLREVNTLLKGQHENIVTVREIVVGSNMDKIYIVMDYVEHDLKSLMEMMRKKKQMFTMGEIKTLMIQLLRAIRHLHDNWILHRDIKTSNLLLSHRGVLKVGDFGLAREYGSPLKHYTPIVVTLWYRSPELLLGSKLYSCPIDVWSCGCVFGELLGMEPMFPGKSEIDQLNKIFKDLGTPSDKIWPGYSDMPVTKKTQFACFPYNHLKERYKNRLSNEGFKLMNSFLTYNPAKRITASDALEHDYFHMEDPAPIATSMFPTWPAKSENPHGARNKKGDSPKPPSGGKNFKDLGDGEDENIAGFFLGGAPSSGPGFTLKF